MSEKLFKFGLTLVSGSCMGIAIFCAAFKQQPEWASFWAIAATYFLVWELT